MANKKYTGLAALDAILNASVKKLGRDIYSEVYDECEVRTTGSLRLDSALVRGGLPVGRVVEIFGWESSGKTSFSLSQIAIAQKIRLAKGINKRDLIIDVEHSLDPSFIKSFGIDMNLVIWVRPNTAEEALQIYVDLIKSGEIDVALLDSVDALQNERQLSRAVGEVDMGGISKDMSRALREISKTCTQTNTLCIFINQIRQNPGTFMGNPNVTPGGNALKFYSAVRIEMMPGKPSKDTPGAFIMRAKIRKNKMGPPPAKEIETTFFYAKGIDPYVDSIEFAKDLGLLRWGGKTGKMKWKLTDTEEETVATGGKTSLRQALASDIELYKKFRDACFEASSATQGDTENVIEPEEDDQLPGDDEATD